MARVDEFIAELQRQGAPIPDTFRDRVEIILGEDMRAPAETDSLVLVCSILLASKGKLDDGIPMQDADVQTVLAVAWSHGILERVIISSSFLALRRKELEVRRRGEDVAPESALQ